MRRIAFGLVVLGTVFVALLASSVLAASVKAQDGQIVIEVDGITRGPAGSIVTIATHAVDPGLIGAICTGTAQTGNNASEHPNNDFILTSGTSMTVIPDWERTAGATVTTTMDLVLGESIIVELRMGPDRVSSGRVDIVLSCSQPEPTTTTSTTTVSPTTTTSPPVATTTTAPPPTVTTTEAPPQVSNTTEPPPRGGVSAGGGGTVEPHATAPLWLAGGVLLLGVAVLVAAFGWGTRGRSDGAHDR
jgi:hypothetical protein